MAVLLAQCAPAAPAWISLVTGAVAALGATIAGSVGLWVALRDSRFRRADLADREAAQARLVSTRLLRSEGRWWVQTCNDSAAPIFRCAVPEVRHPSGTRPLVPVPGAPVLLRRLSPGETADRAVGGDDGDLADAVVVLRFVDAAGLVWRLEGDTGLSRDRTESVADPGDPA